MSVKGASIFRLVTLSSRHTESLKYGIRLFIGPHFHSTSWPKQHSSPKSVDNCQWFECPAEAVDLQCCVTGASSSIEIDRVPAAGGLGVFDRPAYFACQTLLLLFNCVFMAIGCFHERHS